MSVTFMKLPFFNQFCDYLNAIRRKIRIGNGITCDVIFCNYANAAEESNLRSLLSCAINQVRTVGTTLEERFIDDDLKTGSTFRGLFSYQRRDVGFFRELQRNLNTKHPLYRIFDYILMDDNLSNLTILKIPFTTSSALRNVEQEGSLINSTGFAP